MKVYEKWISNIKKCKKYTEELKKLAKEQKSCLENHDIDGVINCLEKK